MPQAAAVISIVATVASTAVSLSAQSAQRDMIRGEAEYNKRATHFRGVQAEMDANTRAEVAIANAEQSFEEAQQKVRIEKRRGNTQRAKILSSMNRRGLSLDSASSEDVLMMQAYENSLKQGLALYEGAKQGERFLYRAEGQRGFGKRSRDMSFVKAQGIEYSAMSRINASRSESFGTFVGGVGSLAGSVSGFHANGTFGDAGEGK